MQNAIKTQPSRKSRLAAPLASVLFGLSVLVSGCGLPSEPETAPGAAVTEELHAADPISRRPYKSKIPSRYSSATPTPLENQIAISLSRYMRPSVTTIAMNRLSARMVGRWLSTV